MERHQDAMSDIEALVRGSERLRRVLGEAVSRWLLISVLDQKLICIEDGEAARSYGVSTAAAGLDGGEGSFGTPPGVHRIARKIGDGMELGTWFRSREPVGRWKPGGPAEEEDLVLTRILTLDGCEDGVNRGEGCDSLSRFIYIHGTNHEDRIGEPVSHGCIRMSNADVINLFERVEEGDPVVIV
jgi:UDP-N-acetylmuramate--alanine ligase